MRTIVILILAASGAWGQAKHSGLTGTAGSVIDNSAITSAKPFPHVSSDPGTCAVGQVIFNTVAATFKGCAVVNTWSSLGSGGGATISSGAYASLPAAGTAGNMYLFTDSKFTFARDTGSVWDHFADGKKVNRLDLSGWALLTTTGCTNSGALTTTNGYNVLVPGTTAADTRTYTKSISGTWTYTFLVGGKVGNNNNSFVGIGVRQGSGANAGRQHLWGVVQRTGNQAGPSLEVMRTSDCVSITADNYNNDQWFGAPFWPTYFQIKNDGTNLTFNLCTDGEVCQTVYSVGNTAYVDLTGSTPQVVITTINGATGGNLPPVLYVLGTLEAAP